MSTEILNVAEVAKLLGCSERTVEDRAREGDLPGLKFGDGGWIFPLPALMGRLVAKATGEAAAKREQRHAAARPVAFHNPFPPTPKVPPYLGKQGFVPNINGLHSLP